MIASNSYMQNTLVLENSKYSVNRKWFNIIIMLYCHVMQIEPFKILFLDQHNIQTSVLTTKKF